LHNIATGIGSEKDIIEKQLIESLKANVKEKESRFVIKSWLDKKGESGTMIITVKR